MAAALLPKLVADSRSSTSVSLGAQPCSACGRGEGQLTQLFQHVAAGCTLAFQACKQHTTRSHAQTWQMRAWKAIQVSHSKHPHR